VIAIESHYVYLASPYRSFDENPEVAGRMEKKRYELACQYAGQLMQFGLRVFSPIAHSHGIGEQHHHVRHDQDFWMQQDEAWLRNASALVVLMLPGWSHSAGVNLENDFWHDMHRAPIYWNPLMASAENIATRIKGNLYGEEAKAGNPVQE